MLLDIINFIYLYIYLFVDMYSTQYTHINISTLVSDTKLINIKLSSDTYICICTVAMFKNIIYSVNEL